MLPFDELDGVQCGNEKYEFSYDCKFIEVKSKNDRLSPKQCLWLKILRSASLDASVCHVLESGAFQGPAIPGRGGGWIGGGCNNNEI